MESMGDKDSVGEDNNIGDYDSPHLVSFLKDRFPELGLDIDTYVPYVLGLLATDDYYHKEEQEEVLDQVVEVLQASSEINTNDDDWKSFQKEVMEKLQQDREWKVENRRKKQQNEELHQQLQSTKAEEENTEEIYSSMDDASTTLTKKDILLQWFMCEENGFTTKTCTDGDTVEGEREHIMQESIPDESWNCGDARRGDTDVFLADSAEKDKHSSQSEEDQDLQEPLTDESWSCAGNANVHQYEKKSKQYEYWHSRIQRDGWELGQSPFRSSKSMVLLACQQKGQALRFANAFLRDDKEVVLQACQKDGHALAFASERLRADKEIVLAAAQSSAEALKYALEGLNQDPDCLVASGLWDESYLDQQVPLKIVLSTRFALTPDSASKATQFAILLKESLHESFTGWLRQHGYIQENNTNLVVYSPNAFEKDTCDPEWTRFDWPCRGTFENCRANPLLKMGVPQDQSCWRYSFRYQLEQAKKANGFMIQLVEVGTHYTNGKVQELGAGQIVERQMAKDVKVKVFRVHAPISHRGKRYEKEHEFQKEDIENLMVEIRKWYEGGCENLSESTLQFDHKVLQGPMMTKKITKRSERSRTSFIKLL